MPTLLTDAAIRDLLREPKALPDDFRKKLSLKVKPGHKEVELDVVGLAGSKFWLILRQSVAQPLDFSVIVSYQPPGTYSRINLRRYNGRSHEHRNVLEDEAPFYDFHIHEATERYQRAGWPRPEAYASRTDRYGSITEALDCAISDCAFRVAGGQRRMTDTW